MFAKHGDLTSNIVSSEKNLPLPESSKLFTAGIILYEIDVSIYCLSFVYFLT